MEYEFIHDSLTGSATARFSMEHELMGPWLEVEVGKNHDKIAMLLSVVDQEKERKINDIIVKGVEYTLCFSEDSVKVIPNRQFDNVDLINPYETEIEENLNTDHDSSIECGIEDFKELLIQWLHFIK